LTVVVRRGYRRVALPERTPTAPLSAAADRP
jgi:hypothetical protein